ncbi:hypothetical protein BB8028_0004g06590 [Beauveria bassiana]|uniref:Uncharacterized protein n=1 Tax=Beauveria bassiana TaxID=176275 RepID=A0A2S7YC07_BEABA|nr:hypothetical protein BB8028_0004g06590 [Beauveria bassiana]
MRDIVTKSASTPSSRSESPRWTSCESPRAVPAATKAKRKRRRRCESEERLPRTVHILVLKWAGNRRNLAIRLLGCDIWVSCVGDLRVNGS